MVTFHSSQRATITLSVRALHSVCTGMCLVEARTTDTAALETKLLIAETIRWVDGLLLLSPTCSNFFPITQSSKKKLGTLRIVIRMRIFTTETAPELARWFHLSKFAGEPKQQTTHSIQETYDIGLDVSIRHHFLSVTIRVRDRTERAPDTQNVCQDNYRVGTIHT